MAALIAGAPCYHFHLKRPKKMALIMWGANNAVDLFLLDQSFFHGKRRLTRALFQQTFVQNHHRRLQTPARTSIGCYRPLAGQSGRHAWLRPSASQTLFPMIDRFSRRGACAHPSLFSLALK